MAHVELGPDRIAIRLSTLDKLWAVHGSLDIPLAHITSASVANEDGWSHLWRKLVGLNAPGLKMAGTFWMNGGLAFLDYENGQDCLVLATNHETYRTVIVQPDPDQDAAALAAEIAARLVPQTA